MRSACKTVPGAGAFAVAFGVPKSAVTVQGKLQSFSKPGDSGKPISRGSCPGCGLPTTDEAEVLPDVAILGVGTLDVPGWVKPTSEIYRASAQRWVQQGSGTRRFDNAPA
jgi:hypothetical protein